MFLRSLSFALGVTLMGAGSMVAQNGPTTGFGAPAAAAPQRPPVPEAIPAPAPPEGERVESTHGDWQVRCAGEGVANCFMFQVAANPGGQPGAEVSLVLIPDNAELAAGITALVPLGVLLQQGLGFSIDLNEGQGFPYNFCTPQGCIARFGIPRGAVDQMRAGNAAFLYASALNVQQNPIRLSLSLRGFTAAHNQLNTLLEQAQAEAAAAQDTEAEPTEN